ncbi:MAG: hypothetical protein HY656_05110 [Acidobacteria bacterium]|nr:hypothetical protein [Acidobacteriota bacterium]
MRRVSRNTYRIGVEPNHAGKYEVRIEARYAGSNWALRVYFLVGAPERLSGRLQAVLRYLQRHEEELWMWGSSPSDRGLLFEEMLQEAGLELDHRRDFSRAPLTLSAAPGDSFRSLQWAELKRRLTERLAARAASRRAEALRSA